MPQYKSIGGRWVPLTVESPEVMPKKPEPASKAEEPAKQAKPATKAKAKKQAKKKK